mmetsp:Transcript_46777/g.118636  ORF Transcript_46777/g.118636 Transcript_46777/m.118636 type:complete len:271 (+) Transcript_46777:310-1122(+)
MCIRPFGEPSKPCFGSTSSCTGKTNLWRSNLNLFGSVLASVRCNSTIFCLNPSSVKPWMRSCCNLSACSTLKLSTPKVPLPIESDGTLPFSGTSRSALASCPAACASWVSFAPINRRRRRRPRSSCFSKASKTSPCFLPNRPFRTTSSLPKASLAAASTSPIVADSGTFTESCPPPLTSGCSTSVTCTVFGTNVASSGALSCLLPFCPWSLAEAGATKRISSMMFVHSSTSSLLARCGAAKACNILITPTGEPSKPYFGSTFLCTVKRCF